MALAISTEVGVGIWRELPVCFRRHHLGYVDPLFLIVKDKRLVTG